MIALNDSEVADLLATAAGSVSYQSNYARTTAVIEGGRWTSKQYARKYLDSILEAQRKRRTWHPSAR